MAHILPGGCVWKFSMAPMRELVPRADVTIATYGDGSGPTLVILPSYGRDSRDDFDHITGRTVGAGWRVLRPQPRGIAGSASRTRRLNWNGTR